MTNTGNSIAAGKLKSNSDALLTSVTTLPVDGVAGTYTGITLNADTGSGANTAIATITLDSPNTTKHLSLIHISEPTRPY